MKTNSFDLENGEIELQIILSLDDIRKKFEIPLDFSVGIEITKNIEIRQQYDGYGELAEKILVLSSKLNENQLKDSK